MKLCSKCGERKSLSKFCKDKQKSTGYTSHCKTCINEQQEKYRQTHKIKAAKYQKRYCKENRGKKRKYAKNYYERNKEKEYERIKEYKKTLKGYVVHIIAGMKQRCSNQKRSSYKNYGGRGIKVCFGSNELLMWLAENEIDPRGLEIHRTKFNGNYTLDNIEFMTKSKHTILHNLKGH